MLNIGDMVSFRDWDTSNGSERPIGIVVGHKSIYNWVKWTNNSMHRQADGGYVDVSLRVLSAVPKEKPNED